MEDAASPDDLVPVGHEDDTANAIPPSESGGDGSVSTRMKIAGLIPIFREAIEAGNIKDLKELLVSDDAGTLLKTNITHDLKIDKDLDISKGDFTPLSYAVALRQHKVVELFLGHGADATAPIPTLGGTALHLAVHVECLESVVLLVGHTDVNQRYSYSPGWTPLNIACRLEKERADIVTCLLDAGADTALRNATGSHTPFISASARGHLQIMKLLYSRGSENQINDIFEGHRPIHLAADIGNLECVKWLINKGVHLDLPNKDGRTPLHLACYAGSMDLAKYLVDNGASVNAKDKHGQTPLHFSSLRGAFEIVCYLIDRGAAVSVRDQYGMTPMLRAMCSLQQAIMMKLKSHGGEISDVDHTGANGYSAVVTNSAPFGPAHEQVMESLIVDGVDINVLDNQGRTALHAACILEKVDIVKCLIRWGADVNAQGPTGLTALMEACCKPQKEIVEILLNAGAENSTSTIYGLTPLHVACTYGHMHHVKALLNAGAKVGQHNRHQLGQFGSALVEGHIEVALEVLRTPAYFPDQPAEKMAFLEGPQQRPAMEAILIEALDGRSPGEMETIMYWAVANGRTKLAEACLKRRGELSTWTKLGATWLHVAALHDQPTEVADLVPEIDVFQETSNGMTALCVAARVGSYQWSKLLLDRANASSTRDGWSKIYAIIRRDGKGESPLGLSIAGRHKQISAIFFDTINAFGTENQEFIRSHPYRGREILEALAQYEKPGNEKVLDTLLKTWSQAPPDDKRVDRYTTLHWAVHSDQPVVVWWLLSKGGYSRDEVVRDAESLALSKTNKIGEVLSGLFGRPPAILPRIDNPNDSQTPEIPALLDAESEFLHLKSTIIDIRSHGKSLNVSYAHPTIKDLIYSEGAYSGPVSIMEKASNLDQRHLYTLKESLNPIWLSEHGPRDVPMVNLSPLGRPLSSHNVEASKNVPETLQLRWIHLPVNEVPLMRDLVTRLSHDYGKPDMENQKLLRHFNRSLVELAAGGGKHYLKPQYVEQQLGQVESSGQVNVQDSKLGSDGMCKTIYMPYLTLSKYTRTGPCPGEADGCSDAIHGNTQCPGNETLERSQQMLQNTITLDQYYYPTIRDTTSRDSDQVVSKFIDSERRRSYSNPNPSHFGSQKPQDDLEHEARYWSKETQILVVGQIWMWIIDERTIITAAAETVDELAPGNLFQSALDSIIYGENRGRFERPTSSKSMMEVILGVATGFFMKKIVNVSPVNIRAKANNKSPLEIFREQIRDVANQETSLFRNFAEGLKDEEEQRKRSQDELELEFTRTIPKNPHHIISDETKLLDDIRDIRDELHILRSLAEDQDVVWKQAFDRPGQPSSCRYYHACTPSEVKKDIEEMLFEADMTNDSINTLLDLRQKQASIKEAEFSRLQANDSARQSNSILVFTMITIIFLPLSFLSSLFALNVKEFPHDSKSENVRYDGKWLFPILFGVSAAVSIPAILLAWKVNSVWRWLWPHHQKSQNRSKYDMPSEESLSMLQHARRLRMRRRRGRREGDDAA